MIQHLLADQLTEPITEHGEGPVWLPGHGLGILDMLNGDVITVNPETGTHLRFDISTVVACLRPRRAGGFVVATERGIALLDSAFRVTHEVTLWSDRRIRMNEGTCDPYGSLWCGSMAYDLTPHAARLWQFDVRQHATPRIDGIGCSNGMGWTESGSHAFYIDSLTDRIDRITIGADGSVRERTPYFNAAGRGFLDGLVVDRDGGIWVALFGSGRLIHISPGGVLDGEIAVPVSQPTSCAFGGPDYSQLFITTSSHGKGRADAKAGAVFVANPTVGGFAAFSYAG